MSSMRLAIPVTVALAVTTLGTPTPASAVSYFLGDMYNFANADPTCANNTTLSYTDDQMRYMDARLQGGGHTRIAWWDNNAFSSDFSEDRTFGGQDNSFADAAELVAFSGHGSGPRVGGVQKFQAPMLSKAAGFTGTCTWDSTQTDLGDAATSFFGNPFPGTAKWLVLCTCFSVDVNPEQQWFNVFQGKMQYVVGYRGTSVDSSNTDDAPADFASDAFVKHKYEFKATWFAAIEDWWFNDTGEVFTRGTSLSNATNRRDHYQSTWPDLGEQNGSFFAFAYHQG